MLMALSGFTQKTNKTFLKNMLLSHPEFFKAILDHPGQKEVQILISDEELPPPDQAEMDI